MPYRRTPATEERRQATRERIAAAALEQVADGGYASAPVQLVARRADVAVGTLYRHFPSKAELFAEVFRRASQRELDVVVAISEADDRPAVERVAAAVEAFSRRALAGPTLAYAQIAEPVDPMVESERLRLRRGYRDAFARMLEEGVAAGELRPHDTQTVAAALVGALGEALVGPLSATGRLGGSLALPPNGSAAARRKEALVATLVQFCLEALPHAHERVHA
jgi:AcrR family transcriptional regulator